MDRLKKERLSYFRQEAIGDEEEGYEFTQLKKCKIHKNKIVDYREEYKNCEI